MSRLNPGDSGDKVIPLLGQPHWIARHDSGETAYVYHSNVFFSHSSEFKVRWIVTVDRTNRVVTMTRGRMPTRC